MNNTCKRLFMSCTVMSFIAMASLCARADGIVFVDNSDQGNVYFIGYESGDVHVNPFASFGHQMADIAMFGYGNNQIYGVTENNELYSLTSGEIAELPVSTGISDPFGLLAGDHLNGLTTGGPFGFAFLAVGTLGELYGISIDGMAVQQLSLIGSGTTNAGGDLELGGHGLLWANSNGELWDVGSGLLEQDPTKSFDGLGIHGGIWQFYGNQSKIYGTSFSTTYYDWKGDPLAINGAASVPEPSSIALLCLGGFGLALRTRRRQQATHAG